MLDEKTKMMLDAARTLTAEDLEFLTSDARSTPEYVQAIASAPTAKRAVKEAQPITDAVTSAPDEPASPVEEVAAASASRTQRAGKRKNLTIPKTQPLPSVTSVPAITPQFSGGSHSRGEYERNRTRESKTSTTCLGIEREKHEWWPLGTQLVGHIVNEEFTSLVVENPSVKSGRSLLITSGPAQGRVCITPTRAAIESTEACRQICNLGRGGGVTNGWEFWKPKTL